MVVKQPRDAVRAASGVRPSPSDFGSRLRALRQQRGYSLAQVAQGAKLSQSFLSLVETGQRGISISRLMQLIQFYGVRLGDVIAESAAGVDPNKIVIHDRDARRYDSTDEGITMFLLACDTQRTMMPGLFEEFVYVLEGEIELTVQPGEPQILAAGDSAYFRAEQPHMYRNLGEKSARMIAVVTPPSV